MFIKCPYCSTENMKENNYCVSCHKPIHQDIVQTIEPPFKNMNEERNTNDGHVIMIVAIHAITTGAFGGLLIELEDVLNIDFGLKSWIQSHGGLFILGLFCFYVIVSVLTISLANRFIMKKIIKQHF